MANTTVQSEQIQDGSITAAKLADGTIVAAELADNAVVTAAINADAVTGAKIADNAINSEHYTDGSIDTAHIADSQITVGKMAANSVDSDQYVDGSIDTVHIADLQVTTAKIANGNISTAKIADNAVTSAKIDTNIDIAGTLDVTGATTLDSTLAVAGATTILTNLSSDTTSTPDTVLTLSTKYASTGSNGVAGAGSRLEFKIPDDETNPITGAAIAGIKEAADDSDASAGMAFYISQNDTTLDEAVRIDHDGKVGIGETAPLGKLHVKNADSGVTSPDAGFDDMIVENSADVGISLLSSDTGTIAFNDANGAPDGSIQYRHDDRSTRFTNSGAERMRIDSLGRMMIGTTTEGRAGEGADMFTIGATSNNSGLTMRSGTSGYGSVYFSDGTSGTAEYAGYLQYNHGADRLHIATASSIRLNVDSDGLKFNGDTAAANALDDYEEGTWTPTIGGWNNTTVKSPASQNGGRYTKIGSLVTVSANITWQGTETLSGGIIIRGLPYSSNSTAGYRAAGSIAGFSGVTANNSYVYFTLGIDAAKDYLYLIQARFNSYSHSPTVDDGGAIYGITFSYHV